MAELVDEWSANGLKKHIRAKGFVIEMQSEGGASGAVSRFSFRRRVDDDIHRFARPAFNDPEHVQDRGRELLPGVFHVSRRALAGHAFRFSGNIPERNEHTPDRNSRCLLPTACRK
jgi:pyruvate-ferredoxin/flavodoxin oxidoreductase